MTPSFSSYASWALGAGVFDQLVELPFALAAAAIIYLIAREMTASRRIARGPASRKLLAAPPRLPDVPRAPAASVARLGSAIQVAGAALFGLTGAVLVVVGLLSQSVWWGQSPPAWVDSEAEAAVLTEASQAPRTPKSVSAVVTPMAVRVVTPTALQIDAGSPIDGRSLVDRWTGRGLVVAPGDDAVSCPSARATPRAYRFNRSSGVEQKAILLVYPSGTALNTDWAVERGSPLAYRAGACGPGGVIYWNTNAVLIIPEIADVATRQILTEVFLTVNNPLRP